MQHAIGREAAGSAPAASTLAASRGARLDNHRMSTAGQEITVTVRLGGRLGAGRRSMRLPAGATVELMLAALACEIELGAAGLAAAAVAVGGDLVGHDHPLRDGDAVALILPVAGG
jgi:sulfur carrier protein ThiS